MRRQLGQRRREWQDAPSSRPSTPPVHSSTSKSHRGHRRRIRIQLDKVGGPSKGLADELVVLAMRANPEPVHTIWHRKAERSVVQTNSNTVKAAVADGLEVQRWMRRIDLQLSVASAGKGLNICGQRFEALPEAL